MDSGSKGSFYREFFRWGLDPMVSFFRDSKREIWCGDMELCFEGEFLRGAVPVA